MPCFKDVTIKFRDPRPVAQKLGLLPPGAPVAVPLMAPEGYGAGMRREEVPAGWAAQGGTAQAPRVIVVPVVNVEVTDEMILWRNLFEILPFSSCMELRTRDGCES